MNKQTNSNTNTNPVKTKRAYNRTGLNVSARKAVVSTVDIFAAIETLKALSTKDRAKVIGLFN